MSTDRPDGVQKTCGHPMRRNTRVISAERMKRLDWAGACGDSLWLCQLSCGHEREIIKKTPPVEAVCFACSSQAVQPKAGAPKP